MRKKTLLFTALSVIFAAMVMSNEYGVAHVNGLNRTGSDGGMVGCEQSGCHSGGTYNNDSMPPTLFITDVNGNPVTGYHYGNTYIIRVKGTSTAPKFGFQVSASHNYQGTTNPAGWLSTLPITGHDTFINNYSVVEQNHSLDVVNDTLLAEVYWLAPNMPGVDSVDFKFTILNINDDGTVDGDNSTSYTTTIINDTNWTPPPPPPPPPPNSVNELAGDIKIELYPNPLADKLHINIENAASGHYTLSVFDLQGRQATSQNIAITRSFTTSINTSSWASGMYIVQLRNGGVKTTTMIQKQ